MGFYDEAYCRFLERFGLSLARYPCILLRKNDSNGVTPRLFHTCACRDLVECSLPALYCTDSFTGFQIS